MNSNPESNQFRFKHLNPFEFSISENVFSFVGQLQLISFSSNFPSILSVFPLPPKGWIWPRRCAELMDVTCIAESLCEEKQCNVFYNYKMPDRPNDALLFGYSKFTWWNSNGSRIMIYSCHADKLSLGFSIHKCALCVYVCVLSGIREWHRLGWVAVLSFGPLIYEHRRRQWRAAELLKGTTTERGIVLLQESFVLKTLLNKEPPLFRHGFHELLYF